MKYVYLKDICVTTQGVQIPKDNQIQTGKNGYIRYLYIADFKNDNDKKYVKDNYSEKIVTENDLVMANTGSPGAVFKGIYGVLSNNLFKITFDKTVLDRDFLYYYLSSDKFQGILQEQMKGGIQKHLGHKTIGEQLIPLINKDIQNKVVKILHKSQELIDKRKEQIEACDELIKSLFYDMFGDIKSEISLSYYIKSLTAGKSLAGAEECKNKVLKTGAVTYDYFDELAVKNLPVDYEPLYNNLVRESNVIISRMNTAELVGAAAYVWRVSDNIYLPDRLWRAELKNNLINPIFLWQLLIQESTKDKIRRIASGTSGSMKNISKQSFLEISVIKVDKSKQDYYANLVQNIYKFKQLMQKSLTELENNFNSLMQRAFKGELF